MRPGHPTSRGPWFRLVPKCLKNDAKKTSGSLGPLDKSSRSSRYEGRSLRKSRLEVYDSSDQTGPLSDGDDSETLDTKRPLQFDIERLSAEFGLTPSNPVEEEDDHCDEIVERDESFGKEETDSTEEESNSRINAAPHVEDDYAADQIISGDEMEDDAVSGASFAASRSCMTLEDVVRRSPPNSDTLTSTSSCLTDSGRSKNVPKATKVCFSTIEVQEYARCPGDNPSVSNGVPLSIGWKIEARHYPISVDDYEAHHPLRSQNCTSSLSKLHVSAVDRLHMLMQWGYSRGELKEHIQRVDKWRAQRKETVETLKRDAIWHRLLFRAGRRKLSKLWKGRSRNRSSEQLVLEDEDSFHNLVDDPAHV